MQCLQLIRAKVDSSVLTGGRGSRWTGIYMSSTSWGCWRLTPMTLGGSTRPPALVRPPLKLISNRRQGDRRGRNHGRSCQSRLLEEHKVQNLELFRLAILVSLSNVYRCVYACIGAWMLHLKRSHADMVRIRLPLHRCTIAWRVHHVVEYAWTTWVACWSTLSDVVCEIRIIIWLVEF